MKNLNGKFGFLLSLFAVLFLIGVTSCEMKPPENSKHAQSISGKVHFQNYCSSCHGDDGKGLKIDSLIIQPADLTKITSSTRNKTFPILEVANFIDGRKMSKAHGSRAMPIWGEVFSSSEHMDESQIKGKLGEIIAYLMTIQD